MTLSRGPRENRQRPSVDVLFRSAARAYGSRVIAVVLTGALDDGTAGAFAVKQRGGLVIVQEPQTALFPSMPDSARRVAPADYCVPLAKMPALLIKLVSEETTMPKAKTRHAARKLKPRSSKAEAAAPFVCPDCAGPLFQDKDGPLGQLRCLVGHSYGPESLSEAHRDALERALLTTMRLLQERANLHRHVLKARQGSRNGKQNGKQSERFQECAEQADKDLELLREVLERI